MRLTKVSSVLFILYIVFVYDSLDSNRDVCQTQAQSESAILVVPSVRHPHVNIKHYPETFREPVHKTVQAPTSE